MLTIRPAQIEAFRPVAEAAFERRVAEYLRAEHGDEVVMLPVGEDEVSEREVKDLDDATFLKMARTGIARARSHGMTWESSITAFVAIMLTVAPNFDSHPLIRRVLADGGVEPDLRIEHLWGQTSEANWDVAVAMYDAGVWGVGGSGEELSDAGQH